MGTGKSSVAAELSKLTGMKVLEMDQEIEASEKMPITEIFEKKGEAYFRNLETALLKRTAAQGPLIVSCGGGVVLRPHNVSLMKAGGVLITLTATPETILKRVSHSKNRPLLNGKKNIPAIREMMESRVERYKNAADCIITTDERSILQIAREALEKFKCISKDS